MFTMLVMLALVAAPGTIPPDAARRAFEDVRVVSEDDGGRLWGRELYGPTLLVDPRTRAVIANQPDSAGVLQLLDAAPGRVPLYAGTLPDSVVIANTATRWSGVRWTMVMWDSVAPLSAPRRRLLVHESFHRLQDSLGLPAATPENPHLDQLEGRYWYLLELRALSTALRDPKQAQPLADALAFRARRHAIYPGAAERERALEANEGVAEYTGFALRGTGPEETRLAAARSLDRTDRGDSFVRSFAYSTGPAYGLLLDAADPQWRVNFPRNPDLASALAAASGVAPAPDPDARAATYGGAELRAQEESRAREQAARVARFRELLVSGPVLEVPMEGTDFGFDPYAAVPLGEAGTAYPTLDISGEWGSLASATGGRIDAAAHVLVFAAAERAQVKLNAGWRIVPAARAGDFRLERAR